MKNNLLPDDTESKPWFVQQPTDDDEGPNSPISFEVPTINFPARSSSSLHDEISRRPFLVGIPTMFFVLSLVLGRIFKRVGVDADHKQLDSRRARLTMQLTNDFIMNNVLLSTQDLQSLIQFYLDKRQNASEDQCTVRQAVEICVH